MAAYFIAEIDVTDPDAYEEYRKQVPASIKAYGGRFLARGGEILPLEGDWDPARVVVLEFDSVEQARRWYDSKEYHGPKLLRQQASRSSVILVEGVG